MCDLDLPVDAADICIDGRYTSYLAQADDIVIFSTSFSALQRKVDRLAHWCSVNFMAINVVKTLAMIFGPLLSVTPVLRVFGSPIAWTSKYTYIGVSLCSTTRYIFQPHYSMKALQARDCANVAFTVDSMTGLVPPWEGTRLYMARVDPHLIHGCDVILDIDAGSLTDLELLQCKYIRRLLGVSTRCSRVFLFTETGLVPLNYRRVLLSLGFLAYALAQPPERLVHLP
ncbi:hypothetical protein EVG20_g10895, partial [Dentipellis fragilis]